MTATTNAPTAMAERPLLRGALCLAAGFNLLGAALFAFPAWTPGRLAGLPPEVPVLYRALVVTFVLLFAGAYAWLAAQASVNRPFVAFGAIGKATAFLVVVALWLAGEATLAGVGLMSGDLALATIFAWQLRRP